MTNTYSTRRKKKGDKALDRYVTFSISSLIIYTIVVIILSIFDKTVPSELTLGFFGFFGGEIVCSMLIKKYKLQTEQHFEGGNYVIQSDNDGTY